MIDLLSPVGDFECLKSAVQNGANSVYFGANLFSARAFASNFNLDELEQAIIYAKTRGVKTNLTLNTLISDEEFDDAFELAKKAYEFGIDAIIVQDLGLAKLLIKSFPNLDIHASTQMSVHNLQGVLELQNLGFKRVVLARELSLTEIEYICKNSNVEIECFIHGALCISYSGQCLFSSMIGGRSGNRGRCAQPCRLPYELLENDKILDKGYLLSTRDLCGLDFIPAFINAGVTCLKIEGRMKNPEYVATVTRIYRKYIDLAESSDDYIIDETDRKILLQAFNRGMSSSGHLLDEPNKKLIYKEKPNNMGLFLGIVEKYNSTKGHLTLKLNETIEIGDTISLEKESGSYTISEIMNKNTNIKSTSLGQTVTIGRMKGNIKVGDKVFKISSKALNTIARDSIKTEKRKIPLNCNVIIKGNQPLQINVTSASNLELYKNLNVSCKLNISPIEAQNRPLTEEMVIAQLTKTTSTPFEFKNIEICLDDNLFLPKISSLNELRRIALEEVQNYAIRNIQNTMPSKTDYTLDSNNKTKEEFFKDFEPLENSHSCICAKPQVSILLNILNKNYDYSKLENIDNIYIPLKYFINKDFSEALQLLGNKSNLFIYLPTIFKESYKNILYLNMSKIIKTFNIKGFVVSNISNLLLLNNLSKDLSDFDIKNFKIVSNYTFNVFNKFTVNELKKLGIENITLSPELDTISINKISSADLANIELIVYGKIPLMNMNYCLLGGSNKCYSNCLSKCSTINNRYYLKDRFNFKFDIVPDNIQTVTTIYNNRCTSLDLSNFENISCFRYDFLYESIEEITNIIKSK